MKDAISEDYTNIISTIITCKGKIIFFGVGKIGNVALKSASTFSSLGIPSFFLSPSEANHGGLGVICPEDVAILLSKNGETSELISIIPYLKELKVPLIAITENKQSVLYKEADYVQCLPNIKEACIFDLAPTSSTTMTMCYLDSLAVAISRKKNF
ncbi:MAG: SIS domain-containing protein [Eubacterium sp.]